MRHAALLLATVALGLAGCPIPQPLPDYPAGTVTPPRILQDQLLEDGALTLVPANCTTLAPYVLSARVVHSNNIDAIEARWFVNYDFRDLVLSDIQQRDVISPNSDPSNLERVVPPFLFDPYRYGPPYGVTPQTPRPYKYPGLLNVVELVVSNGFDPSNVNTIAPGANRTPQAGPPGQPQFATQYHRWVFLTSDTVTCPP